MFSSTSAVYGEPSEIPISEDSPKVPTNSYGESKLFIEKILRRYEQAFGIRSISLRYFNAAGADSDGDIDEDGQPETHLIPLILQTALVNKGEIQILGTNYPIKDGTCIRDYVHVNDLSDAYILALEALATGRSSTAYNLGNGQGFSVREVITTAEKIVGHSIPTREVQRRLGDPAVLVASSERIRSELHWKSKLADLETIIETTWNWHKNHPSGYGK